VKAAIERAGLALLGRIDPERAHGLALAALRAGLGPAGGPVASPRLATRLAGLDLPNPVGLAAGFDKDAIALPALARAGFGFLEVGAITPRAQAGHPRPRLWRLSEDGAAINRFGFNSQGAEAAVARLAERPAGVVLGANLGANGDSEDRPGDFARVLARLGPLVDFATVNVSSPNTERLRELQGRAALRALLVRVLAARDGLARPIPVFVKVSPDLSEPELAAIAGVAEEVGLSGLVATNTTLSRDGLTPRRDDWPPGGLSGQPLFARSTRVLAQLSALTRLPLIGVGGIASAEDALIKIKAGASAVQLYTALAYRGLSLAGEIARGLDAALAREGIRCVAEAVGVERGRWLGEGR
jgi:dihydroorotate dehydrogenase